MLARASSSQIFLRADQSLSYIFAGQGFSIHFALHQPLTDFIAKTNSGKFLARGRKLDYNLRHFESI